MNSFPGTGTIRNRQKSFSSGLKYSSILSINITSEGNKTYLAFSVLTLRRRLFVKSVGRRSLYAY